MSGLIRGLASRTKTARGAAWAGALGLALQAGWRLPETQAGQRPPYLRQGDQAEALLRAHETRLERAYLILEAALETDAPGLLDELHATPPSLKKPGYQALPEILADQPPSQKEAVFTTYSWPQTRRLVAEQSQSLSDFQQRLANLKNKDADERRQSFDDLISSYKELKSKLGWVDSHVRHNRLWQGEIAKDPSAFKRGTELYDKAVRRQEILDLIQRQGTGSALDEAVISTLRQLERKLYAEIRGVETVPATPRLVEILSSPDGHWTIALPLCTDIADETFLDAFSTAVENYWRFEDEQGSYRLKISFRPVSSPELYARDANCAADRPPCVPPQPGQEVDLARHIDLFPTDCAVLTTGAAKLHVRGRAILLGPEDAAPRTLAHEVGHLLGFKDEYLRGFRDLGEEGFEILEAVPDWQDIMCSPGSGQVLKRHFQQLLARRP